MKKTTLIILIGALVVFLTLPSFTSTAQQNSSVKKTQIEVKDHWSINLANVLRAYEEEVNASVKYAAYSEQAQKERNPEIALLFKAVSKASEIHANNHKAILNEEGIAIPVIEPNFKVKSTKENLKDAIAFENEQVTKTYPQFVIEANLAQHQTSKKSMNFAYLTSHKHKILQEKALDAMESYDTEPLPTSYFVCPTCGNINEHDVNPYCGFCETHYKNLIRIED